jgi:hypothetical protein
MPTWTASRANSAPILRTVDDYNVLCWTDDGVSYWALSDIGPMNLENFVQLFRTTRLSERRSPDQFV